MCVQRVLQRVRVCVSLRVAPVPVSAWRVCLPVLLPGCLLPGVALLRVPVDLPVSRPCASATLCCQTPLPLLFLFVVRVRPTGGRFAVTGDVPSAGWLHLDLVPPPPFFCNSLPSSVTRTRPASQRAHPGISPARTRAAAAAAAASHGPSLPTDGHLIQASPKSPVGVGVGVVWVRNRIAANLSRARRTTADKRRSIAAEAEASPQKKERRLRANVLLLASSRYPRCRKDLTSQATGKTYFIIRANERRCPSFNAIHTPV